MHFLQVDPAAVENVNNLQTKVSDTLNTMSNMETNELIEFISKGAVNFVVDVIVCVLIYLIGKWIVKKLDSILERSFTKRNVELSIAKFARSLIRSVLYIIIIYAIVGRLGVDTSSFLAIFASVGVGVGMALSGTLQNFAGGVMVLLNRPFRIGDYICTQGVEGTVKEIKLFNTTINTVDNKLIIVPNGGIIGNIINNYSAEEARRVDWSVSISYGDDYQAAKATIEELLAADSRIKRDPAPFIALSELSDSAVKITVRAWVSAADYWGVFFEMNEKIYTTLPTKGIHFPYPHVTVTVEK